MLFSFRRGLFILVSAFLVFVCLNKLDAFGDKNILSYLSSPIILYFLIGAMIGVLRMKLSEGGFEKYAPGFVAAGLCSLFAIFIGIASYWVGYSALLGALMCILACSVCMLANEHAEVGILKSWAGKLGDSTYSIYLTHSFVLGPAGRLAGRYWRDVPAAAFCLVMAVVAAGLGYLCFSILESRLLKLWARLSKLLLQKQRFD
jgi:peptidoglycan/LPS O-acetylase OafA/YrhL